MRRSLVGAALLTVAACAQVQGGSARENVGTTKQDLIAAPEKYDGTDLGDHELALTFDDGPGPMEVSGALAEWLATRPTPIHVTYFINGACVGESPLSHDPVTHDSTPLNMSCDTPTVGADAVLAKERALGHFIGNHTTTHRDLFSEVLPTGKAKVVQELAETDALIAKHLVWNRLFFRAPYGDWRDPDDDTDTAVFDALKGTAMNKYVGPVYWNVGGGPTDTTRAADWECWEVKKFTTKKCGDLYLKEIKALGNKGIVLMHDAKGDTTNHDINTGVGNTLDMVKYVLGELDKDATKFKFKRLDEIPSIAAVLPKCDATCSDCKGPAATDCTACTADMHVDATGACVAGAPPSDAGTTDDAGATSSGGASSSTSSSSTSGIVPPADAGASATKGEGGCNMSSGDRSGAPWTALAAAIGLVISRRSKRRRT